MLINLTISEYPILNKMNLSPYKFYLSGSRYFEYSRPDSDWDFYAQLDDKLRDWLKFNQFKRIPMHPSWFDSLAEGIYRHISGIEVALVKDAQLKNKASKYLKEKRKDLVDRLKVTSNDEKRLIWNFAYAELLNEEARNKNVSQS